MQDATTSRADKLDQALEMTFPASDPVAVGSPTGTEPSRRSGGGEAEAIGSSTVTAPWMRLWLLPWAMWSAFGLMMMRWPFSRDTYGEKH